MSTATSTVAGRLAKILNDHTGRDPRKFSDTTTLRMVDDLNLDSLDMVEIIMSTEEEFGIEISDEAAEQFVSDRGGADGKTFADWVQWVEGMVKP
jgi:acyl carrier protein